MKQWNHPRDEKFHMGPLSRHSSPVLPKVYDGLNHQQSISKAWEDIPFLLTSSLQMFNLSAKWASTSLSHVAVSLSSLEVTENVQQSSKISLTN